MPGEEVSREEARGGSPGVIVAFTLQGEWRGEKDRIKLVFPGEFPGEGDEIKECYQYVSRSGWHWHYCYEINPETREKRYVYGPVRVWQPPVFVASPSFLRWAWGRLGPTNAETKNVIMGAGFNIDEAYERMLEAARTVIKLTPERTLVVNTAENGIEVYMYRPYDLKLVGFKLPQASLYNFRVYYLGENMPKKLAKMVKFEKKESLQLQLGWYRVTIEGTVYVSRAEDRAGYYLVKGLLMYAPRPVRIYVEHPEHGEKEAELAPGLYLILWIAKRPRHWYDSIED